MSSGLKTPRKSRIVEPPPAPTGKLGLGLTLPDPALPLNEPEKKSDGIRGMTMRLDAKTRKALGHLATDLDCTMHSLILEGIQLVLEKHGRK